MSNPPGVSLLHQSDPVLRMILEVVVHDDHVLALRAVKAGHHGIVLTEVPCEAKVGHHVGVILYQSPARVVRPVRASVVHEHDLKPVARPKSLDHLLHKAADGRLGEVHGDHHGDHRSALGVAALRSFSQRGRTRIDLQAHDRRWARTGEGSRPDGARSTTAGCESPRDRRKLAH